MAFMQPEIEFGVWIEVDGCNGTDWIPPGLTVLPDESDFLDEDDDFDDDAYLAACHDAVRDYIGSREVYSVTERKGYGVRLSAPGYLDCTEWSVFDSEAECKDHLAEFWEVCADCGEPNGCDDEGCDCNDDEDCDE